MKRQRMNNKGFTLIETTVAMLVMLVVGLSATSLFLYSVRYNSGAAQRSVAMAVAQQQLEFLRGVDYYDAGLSFGVHPAQTVVVAPSATTSYTQTPGSSVDGGQPYDAPVSASSSSGGFNLTSQVTPTPTPGGSTGAAPSGSNTFQIQKQVVALPIGASTASATQKRITIRVVPINGNGNSAWSNQNPVEIVFHRSSGVPGPFKQ